MSDAYHQLLDATIQHLQDLKGRGVRFISVAPEALSGLTTTGVERNHFASARPVPSKSAAASSRAESRSAEPTQTAAPSVSLQSLALPTEAQFVSPSALTSEAKAAAFTELRQRVIPCVKCAHLAATRKNVVFGVGDINAQIMFVGEAPGADEDVQGEPFVGRAGQLLTKIIVAMGLSRETVYIANILKCRPDMPPNSFGNRKPTPEEMQTCIPFLHEQIDLIGPKVLVALGATAVEGLLGKTIGITRLRGQWRSYRGIPLMPTFHPSFLLRPDGAREKRKVWEDMMLVMEKIGMPISERQRNYFLNKG
jgi:uracil-DNA glycosylase